MAETRCHAILNESIASLRITSDHQAKDIEEIHKITSIHTRTLNEMNQQLSAILQKKNSLKATRQQTHLVGYSPENRGNSNLKGLEIARTVEVFD